MKQWQPTPCISVPPFLRLIRWLCCRPWESFHLAWALARAALRARGGAVRVLVRDGGMGDVLWAATAARMEQEHSPNDALLLLTRCEMLAAARLAAPNLTVLTPSLASPLAIALLRRCMSVTVLDYTHGDAQGTHLLHSYQDQLGSPREQLPPRWTFASLPDARAIPPTACLYVGPTWAVRELPVETWNTLAHQLRSDLGLRVLQIMPQGESTPRLEACDGYVVGESLANLCNLLDQSALVLTIDSMIMHLAAGTRAPLVAIFGPTLPSARLFESSTRRAVAASVPCAGCHHQRPPLHWESGCPSDIACMKQMTADSILAAAKLVMQRP